jgi:ribosomal protein L44E
MNRTLTPVELEGVNALLTDVRGRLKDLATGDASLHFAIRRKVYKELVYVERGKPAHRKALKASKRAEQNERCAECGDELLKRGAVLNRLKAEAGYTPENTRLLCAKCDQKIQEERGWK